jgi:FtsZ-binding cell division protein ZapB
MDIGEIRGRLDRMRDTLLRGGKFDVDWAVEALRAAREYLDVVEDDEPPVDVDDGFVILPVTRYEALREAEETLEETRFEPADGEQDEKQAPIDALTRRVNELAESNLKWARDYARLAHHVREQRAEIGRLKGVSDRPPDAANTVGTVNTVIVSHIQDLQAEIDGIKDRLDEGYGQFNKIKSRLDEQSDRLHGFIARMNRLESEFADRIDVLVGRMDATDKAVGETLSTIFDRLGAMTSRLNRLDADVMPIRRIGPGTSPEAGQRDKDTGDRPLREIKGVADGVGSTKP